MTSACAAGHTQQHFPWLRSDGAARGKLSNFAEPCHLDPLGSAVMSSDSSWDLGGIVVGAFDEFN